MTLRHLLIFLLAHPLYASDSQSFLANLEYQSLNRHLLNKDFLAIGRDFNDLWQTGSSEEDKIAQTEAFEKKHLQDIKILYKLIYDFCIQQDEEYIIPEDSITSAIEKSLYTSLALIQNINKMMVDFRSKKYLQKKYLDDRFEIYAEDLWPKFNADRLRLCTHDDWIIFDISQRP